MSQLISSAVSGKRAAPKAPVRRRPPAPPSKAPPAEVEVQSQAGAAAEDAPPSDAPPSPPQTQAQPLFITAAEPRRDPEPPKDPTPPPPPSTPPPEDGRDQLEQFVRAQTPEAQREEPVYAASTQQQQVPPAAPMTARATQQSEPPTENAGAVSETGGAPTEQTRKRKSDGVSTRTDAPAKKQKRSSARSNATVQARVSEDEPLLGADAAEHASENHDGAYAPNQVGGEAGQATESAAEGVSERSSRPRATRAAGASPSKAPPKKRKKKATTSQDEDQHAPVDGEPAPAGSSKPKKRQKKAPRVEGETQEGEDDGGSDAELHEIDPNTLSMFELTHSNKYGKVSDREKKMRDIDWDEVKQKRHEAVGRMLADLDKKDRDKHKKKDKSGEGAGDGVVESTEGPSGTVEGREDGSNADADEPRRPRRASPDAGGPAEPPARGLQLRIVNGVIVEDETSLAINAPAAEPATGLLDEVIEEENDLTQHLNRTTYLNDRRRDAKDRIPVWRQKSDPWSEAETERFYEQLAIFGTDFDILSRMFPPKTRRHLKTKFNREERLDPQRINDTLLGKSVRPATSMSLETYAVESGRDLDFFKEFESAQHADEVIRESMREREEAMRAVLVEEEENARQAGIAAAQKEVARKEMEKKRAGRKGRKRGGMGGGTLGGG
ncbi:hypothetical protein LTR53_002790 [Teratosphaeriaceae sp. CCFEE 6253]|nr:hypothetical protein LTR53_002790 [Teratosphaeriaceae sp. CCFEE 6253]